MHERVVKFPEPSVPLAMDTPEYELAEPPRSPPMSHERMSYCLDCIGWSPGLLARRCRANVGSVRQMVNGQRAIPDPLARWLETLAAFHRALPKPF